MKLSTKIVLSIVGALVIIIGLFSIYQFDNIKALYLSKNLSIQETEQKLQENSELRKRAVEGIPVRELTEDECQAIKNGELSNTEALDRIVESSKTDGKLNVQQKQNYEEELAELIGQIYVLEATFSGAVDGLVSSAIAEYKALPPEEHTENNKWEIGLKYLGQASSMESSCDQHMATILGQMESVLIKSGGDLNLINQIQGAYKNEKTLKKNYYLSLYA